MMRCFITYMFVIVSFCFSFSVQAGKIQFTDGTGKIKDKILQREDFYYNHIDSLYDAVLQSGYLNAEISKNSDTIMIRLHELCCLGYLVIDSSQTIQVEDVLPFEKNNFENLMNELIADQRKKGFLFTNYKLEKIELTNDTVTVFVKLDKGPGIIFNKLNISGLKRTKPEVISKYIEIDSTALITTQLLEVVEQDAANIPFLQYNPPVELSLYPGYQKADLLLQFKEKKQFFIQGGAGYISEDKSFVWAGDIRFTNLFGRGREINVRSEKFNKQNQLLKIQYIQPFLYLGRGSADFELSTRDYRDRFYEFQIRSSVENYFSKKLKLGLVFRWKSVEPSDSSVSYSVYASGLSLSSANVDDYLNPGKGYDLKWQLEYLYRKTTAGSADSEVKYSSFSDTRLYLVFNQYWTVSSPIVVHLQETYSGLETKDLLPPLSELYLIGGPGTIRGFRNEQFNAIRVVTGTFEPRYVFHAGFLFLFYDGALMYNRVMNPENRVSSLEQFRYGYGFGFSFVKPDQSITFSFGWNKDLSFDQPRLSIEFSSGL